MATMRRDRLDLIKAIVSRHIHQDTAAREQNFMEGENDKQKC
jgi:hypothetical protein